MADYFIRVVDRDGTVRAQFDRRPERVTAYLNRMGDMTFSVLASDDNPRAVRLVEREVQVFRNGVCIWRGVPLRPGGGKGKTTFRCLDLMWYFDRRVVGKADRLNHLGNASFENALLGDSDPLPTGNWSAYGVTKSLVTTHRFDGTKSVNLQQAVAGQPTYLRQIVFIDGGGTGKLMTMAAHCHLRSDSQFPFGPAYEERGMAMELRAPGNVLKGTSTFPITGDGSFNPPKSFRAETAIWVPPGAGWALDCRLYAPRGDTIWDATSLTAMESLSALQTDPATIIRRLIEHAQDPAFGKSNLGIGTNCPPTGIVRDRVYQHVDHAPILESILDLVGPDDGLDISIDPLTRVIRTHAPRRGTRKGHMRAEYGIGTANTILDYSLDGDAAEASTAIIVQGEGDGPDREEGWAVDSAAFGGVTLEKVIQAPENSGIDILDSLATAELVRSVRMPETISIEVPADWLAVVEPGDTIPVLIDDGWVNINGDRRIVGWELDGERDVASLTLNR